jgi:hypothetical protein
VHGLIHLLGVVKAFRLAEVAQLPPIGRGVGVLWLVAAALLVGAAGLLAARVGSWWLLAAPAIVLSQVLVVGAWSAARAGTVANLLLAVAVVLAWADARFQRDSDAAVRTLLAGVPAGAPVVTREALAGLPAPVARWLDSAGVVGRPRPRVVRLRQRGELRTAKDQAFMPARAEQYFTVDAPGFVWRVRVTMAKVVPVAGRDAYLAGRGRMLIAAGSLVPVVDATGEAIDQGSQLRYLAEIIWFPAAALAPWLRWEPIDDTSARALMTDGGRTVSAVFHFAADGRFLRMDAERYLGGGAEARLTPWYGVASAWRDVRGVRIPVAGVVGWTLPEGEFDYYRWTIDDVEADRPELYPAR